MIRFARANKKGLLAFFIGRNHFGLFVLKIRGFRGGKYSIPVQYMVLFGSFINSFLLLWIRISIGTETYFSRVDGVIHDLDPAFERGHLE